MLKHFFYTFCISFISVNAYADWVDMNTSIDDDLTGIYMAGANGVVSGHAGIYYTLDTGTSWTRFDISGNPSDSTLYNRTRFNHCYGTGSVAGQVVACGRDTVSGQAVIMQFSVPSMSYQVIYVGGSGSSLNKLTYSTYSSEFFAVGDDGLIVRFSSLGTASVVSTSMTYDLLSISFYNNKIAFGVAGRKLFGINNNPGITITVDIPNTGYTYKDVAWETNSIISAVGGNTYLVYNTGIVYQYGSFDDGPGPLNAQCQLKDGAYYFVGTDHGIFRRNATNLILEWQPSSLTHAIQSISRDVTGSVLYAVGENGTILSTSDSGGTPFPYASFSGIGGCVNTNLVFTPNGGPSISNSWYVDGTFMATTSGFSQNFPVPGQHEIMLIGTKGGMADTFAITIHVVEVPEVDYSIVISDSILCHKEVITVSMSGSETNVRYVLFDSGFQNAYSNPAIGTGTAVVFNSDSISEDGNYYIQSQSTLAVCKNNFTVPINIDVEHTKAAYHSTMYNATEDEPVLFIESCTDAQNYSWSFSPAASTATSSMNNPTVAFGNSGATDIELTCWSDNGCYDSIAGAGPFIYTPAPQVDSCWINVKQGTDQQWTGSYNQDISEIQEVGDGFLVVGQYSNDTMESQQGIDYSTSGFGAYLSKYSFDGAIRWITYIPQTSSPSSNQSGAIDMAVDPDGNIYVLGGLFSPYIMDNGGDSINGIYGNGPHTLIKFDSLGRFIWATRTNTNLGKLEVNHQGHIFLTMNKIGTGSAQCYYFSTDSTVVNPITYTSPYNHAVLEIDPNGMYIEHFGINLPGPNLPTITELTFDQADNLYLTGSFVNPATFYNTDETTGGSLTSSSGSSHRTWVAKYDFDNNFAWASSIITNALGAGNYPNDIAVHPTSGITYVTGRAPNGFAPKQHLIRTPGGVIDTSYYCGFYLASFNSDGSYRWANGGYSADFGEGSQLLLDDTLIYIVGIHDSASTHLMGTDGTAAYYSSNMTDFFLATYDMDGHIIALTKSGDNADVINAQWPIFNGLFLKDGCFYTGRNGSKYSNTGTYYSFGDSISTLNGNAGMINKFALSCGINFPVSYCYPEYVALCSGSSYTFPDGTTSSNITSNFSHSSHLYSTTGLDSIVATFITVNPLYSTTSTVSICQGSDYTFPDGSTLSDIQGSTSHASFFTSQYGCDSILTVNLAVISLDTVASSSSGTIVVQGTNFGVDYAWFDCGNGYSPAPNSGPSQVYTPIQSGSYAAQVSFQGCIDTTNCIQVYRGNETAEICYGETYLFPDGISEVLFTSTDHTSYLQSIGGADSVIVTTVTVHPFYQSTVNITACPGEDISYPDSTTDFNIQASTTHISNLYTATGCDSTILTIVTVNPIATAVVQIGDTISSSIGGGSYAWLDCNANLTPVVPAANDQWFVPEGPGSYAVQIVLGSCIDTSACFAFDIGKISEVVHGEVFFYPNPARSELFIRSTTNFIGHRLLLLDALGKVLQTITIEDELTHLSLTHLSPGVYYLKDVESDEGKPFVKY